MFSVFISVAVLSADLSSPDGLDIMLLERAVGPQDDGKTGHPFFIIRQASSKWVSRISSIFHSIFRMSPIFTL